MWVVTWMISSIMREFDALCLPLDASTAEVKGLTREQIQALRNRVDDELK